MWVDGRLYGGHTKGDFEHAEVVVFIGKNPWQSHSFPRARSVLKEIANDPGRAMIVIDPRRSETAAMADVHLQVRPGTDAWCLGALGAVIVQEGLVDHEFVSEHTTGAEPVLEALAAVPVAEYAARCGVSEALIRAAARRFARAESACTYEDLGVQQAPNSTLSSYLNKLLWILTGNFAKPGAMFLHSTFAPIAGSSAPGGSSAKRTPVTGARIIAGLIPCNSIADEILTDHSDRFRAIWIDSVNPVHSLAESARFREAMRALDLSVVVDVAMTETARLADYVLPATSQYEKWEATFFNAEFPRNTFHLRAPLLEPLPGTLPEPEIYARLIRELAVVDRDVLASLRDAAEHGRGEFARAFFTTVGRDPGLMRLSPYLLYETLGPTLDDGATGTAALWGVSQICAMTYPEAVARAGFEGEGFEPGEALFEAILTGRAVVFTLDDYSDAWNYVRRPDKRFTIEIPELLEKLRELHRGQTTWTSDEFPFVLSAGERRAYTANTIIRDPRWHKRDPEGALRISVADAERLELVSGARVRVVTEAGSAEVLVSVSEMMQPGHISLPNGLGVDFGDEDGGRRRAGVAPNELTSVRHRDWLAGTPWHKHVPARVEAIA
jgi:anaerobic selenocysteine-containing dehydrogenase